MDFNTTLDYLGEEDLNKCGFSLRSLSSISFNKGMAVFSISSILSADKSLTERFLSSKTKKLCTLFLDVIYEQDKGLNSILFLDTPDKEISLFAGPGRFFPGDFFRLKFPDKLFPRHSSGVFHALLEDFFRICHMKGIFTFLRHKNQTI